MRGRFLVEVIAGQSSPRCAKTAVAASSLDRLATELRHLERTELLEGPAVPELVRLVMAIAVLIHGWPE